MITLFENLLPLVRCITVQAGETLLRGSTSALQDDGNSTASVLNFFNEFSVLLKQIIELGLPFAAILLSIASLLIAIRNWRQSNRPIVAALIRTHSGGNVGINYNLVVINAGSRPAVDIAMTCKKAELQACLHSPNADKLEPVLWRSVAACFEKEGNIPLLLHGTDISGAFGRTGEHGLWNPGASLPIVISYRDLEGRKYTSRLNLVIKDSGSFNGGAWRSKE